MLGQEYADVPYIGPPNGYRRDPAGKPYVSNKRWAVAHCTSNTATDTAEARYALNREDRVSSHWYIDADSITQSLNTSYQANHVGSLTGNTYGISYEFVGQVGWSRSTWLTRIRWDLAGRQLARDAIKHGIPLRAITLAELEDGKHGIITHDMARRAWGGTTHTDPGSGFPMDVWISNATQFLEENVKLYRVTSEKEVYLYDGAGRRHVPDEAALARVKTATGIASVTVLATRADLDLIAPAAATAPPPINITDEQLTRVLHRVIFGTPPEA